MYVYLKFVNFWNQQIAIQINNIIASLLLKLCKVFILLRWSDKVQILELHYNEV